MQLALARGLHDASGTPPGRIRRGPAASTQPRAELSKNTPGTAWRNFADLGLTQSEPPTRSVVDGPQYLPVSRSRGQGA